MKINNAGPAQIRTHARRLARAIRLNTAMRLPKAKKIKKINCKCNNVSAHTHHSHLDPQPTHHHPQLLSQRNDEPQTHTQNMVKMEKFDQKQKETKSAKANSKGSAASRQHKNKLTHNSSNNQQEATHHTTIQENTESQHNVHELVPLDEANNLNSEEEEKPKWYFSDKKFTDFQLSEPTLRALKAHQYHLMSHIQARTLPHLLRGADVLGSAKTGSGKTLAYLIPCFEKLRELEFKQLNGTGAIVITPTRELAIQVFDVAKQLGEFHHKTIGLLIGGMNRKMESVRLEKGVNLLICTPGRLLDHLQNSKFIYRNLFCLVIDEADALLRIGFEQELTDILKVLPKERQTLLFSATQTRKIEDLAKLSLHNPLYIGVDDTKDQATVENLEQGFVVVRAADKFRLLLTFLRKQQPRHKKMMVFFSSCNAVKFYSDLLNFIDISVMDIHGKQKQQKRSTTFYEFSQLDQGTLLCTDVAARGLDIPQVDWIVQYDPPLDIKEYIHRVGRTCRGASAKGKALLFLLEEERGYLKHLLQAKVQLNEYEFEDSKLEDVQEEFEMLVSKNSYLHGEALCAFKSYLHAYTTYNLKEVFNVHALDLSKVALSFGLAKAPHVDLNLKLGGARTRKLKGLANK